MINEKKCTRCEIVKPLIEFPFYDGKPYSWCRECQRAASREYSSRNRQRQRDKQAAWRKANPEESKRKLNEWRIANPDKLKSYNKVRYLRDKDKFVTINRKKNLSRYGVTVEQYEAMYREQNGACAICEGLNLSGRRLAVDHDHKTGQIRGLLCSRCNSAVGLFREDLNLMRRAFEYIEGIINMMP